MSSVVYVRMNYVVEYAVKEKRHPLIVQMVHPYLFLASRLANCTVHADVLGASSGFMGLLPKLQITSGFFVTRDTAVTTKLQLDGHLELQWTCLRVVLFFSNDRSVFFLQDTTELPRACLQAWLKSYERKPVRRPVCFAASHRHDGQRPALTVFEACELCGYPFDFIPARRFFEGPFNVLERQI